MAYKWGLLTTYIHWDAPPSDPRSLTTTLVGYRDRHVQHRSLGGCNSAKGGQGGEKSWDRKRRQTEGAGTILGTYHKVKMGVSKK